MNLDSIRATVASFSLRKFELRAHITYQHLAAKPPLRPPTLSGQIKGTWNQILLTIYPIYNTDCPLEFTNLILDCSAIEHVWIGWQKGEHLTEREREILYDICPTFFVTMSLLGFHGLSYPV